MEYPFEEDDLMDNPLQDYGVEVRLFAAICYKLSNGERMRVDEGKGVVGACYRMEIGGVPLLHRNVKDGSNGYYWTYGLVGMGWSLRAAISMGIPKDGRPTAAIIIRSLGEDRQRYIFSPTFEGDIERMKRDLTLARLFLD